MSRRFVSRAMILQSLECGIILAFDHFASAMFFSNFLWRQLVEPKRVSWLDWQPTTGFVHGVHRARCQCGYFHVWSRLCIGRIWLPESNNKDIGDENNTLVPRLRNIQLCFWEPSLISQRLPRKEVVTGGGNTRTRDARTHAHTHLTCTKSTTWLQPVEMTTESASWLTKNTGLPLPVWKASTIDKQCKMQSLVCFVRSINRWPLIHILIIPDAL